MNSQPYFNPAEPEKPCLFVLEPSENFVGIVSVNVRFSHQWEGDAVIARTEFDHGGVVDGLLPTKLEDLVRDETLRVGEWGQT
jgi:hypothetical protein